jgi:hypothetical protein
MSAPTHLKCFSRSRLSTALGLTLLVALAGCAKKPKEETKAEVPAAAAPSQSPAEKRAEEQKTVEELAQALKTQEDFEEAAEQDITAQSVEGELAKLGAEIEGDPDTVNPNAGAGAAPAASAAASAK